MKPVRHLVKSRRAPGVAVLRYVRLAACLVVWTSLLLPSAADAQDKLSLAVAQLKKRVQGLVDEDPDIVALVRLQNRQLQADPVWLNTAVGFGVTEMLVDFHSIRVDLDDKGAPVISWMVRGEELPRVYSYTAHDKGASLDAAWLEIKQTVMGEREVRPAFNSAMKQFISQSVDEASTDSRAQARYNARILELAARQEWVEVLQVTGDAYRAGNHAPEIYLNLGLSSVKLSGTGAARALLWLRAYLTKAPDAPNRAAVKAMADKIEAQLQADVDALIAAAKSAMTETQSDDKAGQRFPEILGRILAWRGDAKGAQAAAARITDARRRHDVEQSLIRIQYRRSIALAGPRDAVADLHLDDEEKDREMHYKVLWPLDYDDDVMRARVGKINDMIEKKGLQGISRPLIGDTAAQFWMESSRSLPFSEYADEDLPKLPSADFSLYFADRSAQSSYDRAYGLASAALAKTYDMFLVLRAERTSERLQEADRLAAELQSLIERGPIGPVKDALIRSPWLLNERAPNGQTPLHQAAISGNGEAAEYMIAFGADAEAINVNGLTPLHEAARSPRGAATVLRLLLLKKNGLLLSKSFPDKDPDGLKTNWHLLWDWHHLDRRDPLGRTALHAALVSLSGEPLRKAVSALVDAGSDCSTEDDLGVSALDLAALRDVTLLGLMKDCSHPERRVTGALLMPAPDKELDEQCFYDAEFDSDRMDAPTDDERIKACMAVIAAGRDTPPALAVASYNLGRAFFNKSQFKEAIAAFDRSIAFSPTHTYALPWRGLTNRAMGDRQSAIRDLDRAVELEPGAGENVFLRGYYYDIEGNKDAALRDYSQAIKLDADKAERFLYRGRVHLGKGEASGDKAELAAAIGDFDSAIRISDEYPAAWAGRCRARLLARQPDGAVKDCTRAAELSPGDAGVLGWKGLAHLGSRQFDAAIAAFDAALKIDPGKATALYGRGVARRSRNEVQRGNADISAARALQSDIADTMAREGVRP